MNAIEAMQFAGVVCLFIGVMLLFICLPTALIRRAERRSEMELRRLFPKPKPPVREYKGRMFTASWDCGGRNTWFCLSVRGELARLDEKEARQLANSLRRYLREG